MRPAQHVFPLACMTAVVVLLGGCVVHDNSNAPEPSWWPTFLLRQETVKPTGGKVNVNVDPKGYPDALKGGGNPQVYVQPGTLPSAESVDAMRAAATAAPAPVWFDPGTFYDASAWYQPQPYSRLNGGAQAPPAYPQQNTPTLYPNRGQAALEAGSPTLYPPTGTFQTSPQHDVTLYPRGPVGPRGYRGQ